jgi:hypothetical protein
VQRAYSAIPSLMQRELCFGGAYCVWQVEQRGRLVAIRLIEYHRAKRLVSCVLISLHW